MTNEWSELTDEKLARIAQEGLQGQGAPVEAMRRLRVAIEQSSAKSDVYSRRIRCRLFPNLFGLVRAGSE